MADFVGYENSVKIPVYLCKSSHKFDLRVFDKNQQLPSMGTARCLVEPLRRGRPLTPFLPQPRTLITALHLSCVRLHLEEPHEGAIEGAHCDNATVPQVPHHGGVRAEEDVALCLPLGHT